MKNKNHDIEPPKGTDLFPGFLKAIEGEESVTLQFIRNYLKWDTRKSLRWLKKFDPKKNKHVKVGKLATFTHENAIAYFNFVVKVP